MLKYYQMILQIQKLQKQNKLCVRLETSIDSS